MIYLLRSLLVLALLGVALTMVLAYGFFDIGVGHIQTAVFVFIMVIFVQAFVMFYFIGVERLAANVFTLLKTRTNLEELFDDPPDDIGPYLKSVSKLYYQARMGKKKTLPWSILILVLGMIAFLLGGAFDTGLVGREAHSGVVYGFFVVLIIGFFRQWYYLGKSHHLLRRLKRLFDSPDGWM